jgi:hypothetical protein
MGSELGRASIYIHENAGINGCDYSREHSLMKRSE